MKSIIFSILFFTALTTFAQNQAVGIVAGPSWMNVNSIYSNLQNNSRNGFTLGITYENRLKKHLLFGVDLMYYQRGFQSPIPLTYKGTLEPLLYGNYRYEYNYMALPLKVGYIKGNKVSAFANIGLVPSYMVNAKLYLPTGNSFEYAMKSGPNDISPHNYRENLTDFDLAGLVEVGTNIKLTSRFMISATASYQHSFTTLTSTDHFDGLELTNYGFALTGGLKYVL